MTLIYNQTAEDYMDFNFYYSWSSPEKSKHRLVMSLLPFTCFVLLVLASKGMNFQHYGWAEYYLFAFGILTAVTMGWLVRWRNKSNIRRLISSGKNIDMVGKRTLFFEEEKLIAQTENTKAEIQWTAFEKVRETKDHFFLFVHVNQAIVVPKRLLSNPNEMNNFRNFVFKRIM